MGEELLRPAEVCKKLGLAPSTLRIYSTKFAEVLSEGAGKPGGGEGRGGSRVYTPRDVMVLGRAKELLTQGLTYEEVLAELRSVMPGARDRGRVEAVAAEEAKRVGGVAGGEEVGRLVEALRGAVGNAERSLELLHRIEEREEREVAVLRERVDRLERMIEEIRKEKEDGRRKGWIGRLFGG